VPLLLPTPLAMAEPEANNAKYGEEVWRAAGCPMFTRLYSYDELLTIERPPGFRNKKPPGAHQDVKRPDNWPDDTQVYPGSWVFWLPEGWMQGIRTQAASGKTLMCYMSPTGKRFWHKKDIEKFLGKDLPKQERPEKKEDEDGKAIPRVRYVSDPDAIPHWPEDGEIHVPKDFKCAFRQLPSGLHPIYIPPGKDNEGFLYQKHLVPLWVSGELTRVTPFDGSTFMANAGEKKKRKLEDTPATLEDFKAGTSLKTVSLEGPPSTYAAALGRALRDAAGAPDAAPLASDARTIHEKLLERGFKSVHLIYASSAPDGGEPHPLGAVLSGFYYRKNDAWADKPMYQSIVLQKSARAGVVCGHAHLFWSPRCAGGGRWKLGRLTSDDDDFAGCLALSAGTEMSGRWLLAPLQ